MNALKVGHPELVQTTTLELAMLIARYMEEQYKWPKSTNLHWAQINNPAFQKGGWVLSLRGNAVTWVDVTSSVAPKVASLREFIALVEEEPLKLGSEPVKTDASGVQWGSVRVPWDTVDQVYQRSAAKGPAVLKEIVPEYIEVTSPELALAAAAYMNERHEFIRANQLRGADPQLLKMTDGLCLRLRDKEIRWIGGLGSGYRALRVKNLQQFIDLVEAISVGKGIIIEGHCVEFKSGGVQIGCQFVPDSILEAVHKKGPSAAKLTVS